jgi:hypothetical protein
MIKLKNLTNNHSLFHFTLIAKRLIIPQGQKEERWNLRDEVPWDLCSILSLNDIHSTYLDLADHDHAG